MHAERIYLEVTSATAGNNSCPMGHLYQNYRASQSIKVVKIFRALRRFVVTFGSENTQIVIHIKL